MGLRRTPLPPLPFATVFADVPDPRRETANTLPAPGDLPTIATCAVIAGAASRDDMAEDGQAKEGVLRRSLPLAHGLPSPDPFARVAVALARRAPGKVGGATTRKTAGWDDEFLGRVLNRLSESVPKGSG